MPLLYEYIHLHTVHKYTQYINPINNTATLIFTKPIIETGARPKTGTKRTRNNDLDESQILPTRTRSRNNSQLPRQIESAKETVTTPANSDLSHNDSSLHPLGLQTTSEAAAGATGGLLYDEDHPPTNPLPPMWRHPAPGRLSKQNKALKKVLEATYKKQVEIQKREKEKKLVEIQKKKDKIRDETRKLISEKTGDTMKCPDCNELKHRGGGMITHRLNFCSKRNFE